MDKASKAKARELVMELQNQAAMRGTWARALTESMQPDTRENVLEALRRAREREQAAADQLVALIDAS